MSLANDSPELTHSPGEIGDELIIPLKSLTKTDIEYQTRDWTTRMLQLYGDADLYVYLKQIEYAVKVSLDRIRENSFNAISEKLMGEMRGKFMGHDVKLSYPETWVYSSAHSELKAQQKLELEALEAKERAEGKAHKEPQFGRITVTLKNRE